MEKRSAEFGFEFAHLLAERGLREMQAGGGAGEIPLARGFEEVFELVKFHRYFRRVWTESTVLPAARNRVQSAHTHLPIDDMTISDLSKIEGRRYPARRRTQNLVGGVAPVQAANFAMGNVTLDPQGGQVPWHNQEQEEIYFIVEGTGEMCLGAERQTVAAGQLVYIPSGVFHQLTNIGETPLRMIYCYGPSGDVAHWRQELAGTLPKAGVDAPPLPAGAQLQCTAAPAADA